MKTKILLVLFGCVAGFFSAEASLRFFIPDYVASAGIERDYFCQFDGEIGWRPLPNVTGRHQPKGFSVNVHQNQFGLRGPDSMVREKDSPRERMLVLGDSFVWGYGVDQKKIFTASEVHGSETELINFGVSGYGTDQEYLFYLQEGVLFEVDEVVLAVTPYNDVENNLSEEQYDKQKPYFTLSDQHLVLHSEHVRENKVQGVVNWIMGNSRVVNLLDTAHRYVKNRWRVGRDDRKIPKEIDGILDAAEVSARDRQGMQLTIRIIEALREAVLAAGAHFSVVFIPYKPHIVNNYSYNHPFVRPLAEKLEATNIDYYEPFFVFATDQAGDRLFNKSDNHFSPMGHALFGQVLVDPGLRERIKNLYSRRDTPGREQGVEAS